ncbi:MAG: PilN domain-containing protein [Planctomycetota bacterium]|jgi:hypothetical protein
MIRINLLPEERRPAERTPLPRFLIYVGGLVGFGAAALLLVHLFMKHRTLEDERTGLIVRINSEQTTINRINDLNREIAGFRKRKDEIQDLYKERRRWGPILYMLHDDKVLPPHFWFKEKELKKSNVGGGKGKEPPFELVVSAYARGKALVTMVQGRNEFARNIANSDVYAAEFEGKPAWPKIGEMKDLRAQAEGALPDTPKEAFAFAMKLTLQAGGGPTRPKR